MPNVVEVEVYDEDEIREIAEDVSNDLYDLLKTVEEEVRLLKVEVTALKRDREDRKVFTDYLRSLKERARVS